MFEGDNGPPKPFITISFDFQDFFKVSEILIKNRGEREHNFFNKVLIPDMKLMSCFLVNE